MDRHQIDWQQKQDASKIEKDLMQRTEDLDDRDNNLDIDIQNLKTVVGPGITVSPEWGEGGITITSSLEDLEQKQSRFRLELDILHLSSLGKIDAAEHRRLLTLLDSPDGENIHVAVEIITTKMKEL